MPYDDYTLTIEDVSKRLNKSVRTIHRYKDGGRLTFVVGTTQGNPLYFSSREVMALAKDLYPNLATQSAMPEPEFWDRVERVERLINILEGNPLLERFLKMAGEAANSDARSDLEDAIQALSHVEQRRIKLDNRELGQILIRLGNAMLKS